MRKMFFCLFGILVFLAAGAVMLIGQSKPQSITTNKDKLLTLAVQGRIAPAQPSKG